MTKYPLNISAILESLFQKKKKKKTFQQFSSIFTFSNADFITSFPFLTSISTLYAARRYEHKCKPAVKTQTGERGFKGRKRVVFLVTNLSQMSIFFEFTS